MYFISKIKNDDIIKIDTIKNKIIWESKSNLVNNFNIPEKKYRKLVSCAENDCITF